MCGADLTRPPWDVFPRSRFVRNRAIGSKSPSPVLLQQPETGSNHRASRENHFSRPSQWRATSRPPLEQAHPLTPRPATFHARQSRRRPTQQSVPLNNQRPNSDRTPRCCVRSRARELPPGKPREPFLNAESMANHESSIPEQTHPVSCRLATCHVRHGRRRPTRRSVSPTTSAQATAGRRNGVSGTAPTNRRPAARDNQLSAPRRWRAMNPLRREKRRLGSFAAAIFRERKSKHPPMPRSVSPTIASGGHATVARRDAASRIAPKNRRPASRGGLASAQGQWLATNRTYR